MGQTHDEITQNLAERLCCAVGDMKPSVECFGG
jgi:hypothetical protein